MQRTHKRFHLGIFGSQGKTTYALKFVSNAASQCVFLFDAEGEFSEVLDLQPARTTYELDQAIRSGWVCFDPHVMFPGELETALEYFCTLTLEASKRMPGRKFFVLDEAGTYVTGNFIPKPLKTIAQTGRRYGIDGVFIGQQPNELHNTIRCQLTEVVCFQITDDTALEFPKKFGFDPEAVRTLPRFGYICRNNRGGEARSSPGPSTKASAGRRRSAPEPACIEEPGQSQSNVTPQADNLLDESQSGESQLPAASHLAAESQ